MSEDGPRKAGYAKEADLCADFVKHLPEGWIAYGETGGFDLLLVRSLDGAQVGVEAKLVLNSKVIEQAAEDRWANHAGPDFRAVLVPHGVAGTLLVVCELIGLSVIAMKDDAMMENWRYRHSERFRPALPLLGDDWSWRDNWFDRCPHKRIELPEYVPDVVAGQSAPKQLSKWKIKAIKISIILDRRGWVARSDFAHLQIDIRRWIQPGFRWLEPGGQRGIWIAGPHLPDFKKQHPINFEQIAADFEKWEPPAPAVQMDLADAQPKENNQ